MAVGASVNALLQILRGVPISPHMADAGIKVLFIDDEPLILRSVERTMRGQPFQTFTAKGARLRWRTERDSNPRHPCGCS